MDAYIETSWCNFDANIHLTDPPYDFKRSEIWDQKMAQNLTKLRGYEHKMWFKMGRFCQKGTRF